MSVADGNRLNNSFVKIGDTIQYYRKALEQVEYDFSRFQIQNVRYKNIAERSLDSLCSEINKRDIKLEYQKEEFNREKRGLVGIIASIVAAFFIYVNYNH